MAYTEIPLPHGVWVLIATGPAEGLATPSFAGDIRWREESTVPSNAEDGSPIKVAQNFVLEDGSNVYAKCKNTDSNIHVDIAP